MKSSDDMIIEEMRRRRDEELALERGGLAARLARVDEEAEVDDLRRLLAAAKKDTARLDFLEREQADVLFAENGRVMCVGSGPWAFGATAREAIDRAMKEAR